MSKKKPAIPDALYAEMARVLDAEIVNQIKNGVPVVDRDGFPVLDPNTGQQIMKPCPPTVLSTALRRLAQVGHIKPTKSTDALAKMAEAAARAKPTLPPPGQVDEDEET